MPVYRAGFDIMAIDLEGGPCMDLGQEVKIATREREPDRWWELAQEEYIRRLKLAGDWVEGMTLEAWSEFYYT